MKELIEFVKSNKKARNLLIASHVLVAAITAGIIIGIGVAI